MSPEDSDPPGLGVPRGSGGYIMVITILIVLVVSVLTVGSLFQTRMGRTSALNYKHRMQTFHAADGMVTLLTQEILSGRAGVYVDTAKMGRIYGSVWTGLGGNTVSHLKAAILGGTPRARLDSSTYLGSNWNASNYGVAWSGWLLPPFTGQYRFHVRSNMASHFYLNQDGSAPIDFARSNAPLCSLTAAQAAVKGWPASDGISEPVTLEAGRFYFFQFFHKAGAAAGADDLGQVGWEGPEWVREFPIPRDRLFHDTSAPPFKKVTLGTHADSSVVRYQMSLSGLDQYALVAEALQRNPRTPGDTSFRIALNQKISLRSKPSTPPVAADFPVAYYDYRADGSNPEFQATFNQMLPPAPPPWHPYLWNGYVVTGLVRSDALRYAGPPEIPASHLAHFGLSAVPKPIRNPAKSMITCNLDKWFVPWMPGSPGNDRIPQYADIGAPNYTGAWPSNPCDDGSSNTERVCWKGNFCYFRPAGSGSCASTPCYRYDAGNCATVAGPADNFENKVRLDQLTFLLQPNGSYKFSRSASDGTGVFTPIDGWGFGDQTWTDPSLVTGTHNYAFCMELHAPFVHASGLTFDFSGDDDVWVFINDSLVIDLGFAHEEAARSLNLDDLPLEFGRAYRLDLFYCERTGPGSNLMISTNIPISRTRGEPAVRWTRSYGGVE